MIPRPGSPILPSMRRIPVILLTLLLAAPAAADLPVRRALENLSRGLRFEIKLTAIAQAPSDPDVIYVGTQHGRVHVSRDGGQSWEESTALTKRGSFYGAIRKQDTSYRHRRVGFFNYRPSDMWSLRLRSAGNSFRIRPGALDMGARGYEHTIGGYRLNGQAAESLRRATPSGTVRGPFDDQLQASRWVAGGSARGGGSDLAVGIKSGAPRLAYQVRRKRKWGIGINLQQTLALKAAPATGIWFFDVDPQDPNDVLAATADGLRRSRDGGYSWPLVLTGPTPRERSINHLARHPNDPDVIYAGTGRGLQISTDGGGEWEPAGHPFVVASDIRWVDFDRTRRDVFYVGATWGLLRTEDGGKNFGLAYRSSWPPQSLVRQVQIDPHRPEKIWLATADGLMVSEDDGQTFERAGGLLFVGTNVKCLSPGTAPGHMIAVTDTEIWETRDGGQNWQIALFGRVQWKITYGMFEVGRPESMLVLTEAEVLRYGPPRRARPVSEALLDRYRRTVADEASQSRAVTAALKQAGLYRPDRIRFRRNARWASLLPRVQVLYGWREFKLDADTLELLQTAEDALDATSLRSGSQAWDAWAVFGTWDLAPLVFSRSEAPIARVGRTNTYGEWSVRSTVINMYQERRRLLFEAFVDERPDPRAELMRRLRIEELTAHLNAMTGGLFEPAEAL